jgi:hypothetical protein
MWSVFMVREAVEKPDYQSSQVIWQAEARANVFGTKRSLSRSALKTKRGAIVRLNHAVRKEMRYIKESSTIG